MIDYLESCCGTAKFILLSGMTGTGKTDIIKKLDSPNIDLEKYANHKGSSFGKPLNRQPSQIDFETNIVLDLIKIQEEPLSRRSQTPRSRIVLEDESSYIGSCHIPMPLVKAMRSSPMVVIELPFEERIDRLWQEYVLDRYKDTCTYYTSISEADGHISEPAERLEQIEQAFADRLRDSLSRIARKLGKQRTKEIMSMMEDAIKNQRNDNFMSHRVWLRAVTSEYYDPMYTFNLNKRKEDIVFTGNEEEVIHYLSS